MKKAIVVNNYDFSINVFLQNNFLTNFEEVIAKKREKKFLYFCPKNISAHVKKKANFG